MKTTKAKHLPHTWINISALAVFTLGIGAGFVRSADLVAKDFLYTGLTHTGRVAGESVTVTPGPVTIAVDEGARSRTYTFEITEPISVFNLIRIAQKTIIFRADVQISSSGATSIASVDGIAPSATQEWRVSLDGEPVSDLNAPVVVPGSALAFVLEPITR